MVDEGAAVVLVVGAGAATATDDGRPVIRPCATRRTWVAVSATTLVVTANTPNTARMAERCLRAVLFLWWRLFWWRLLWWRGISANPPFDPVRVLIGGRSYMLIIKTTKLNEKVPWH